MARRGRKTKLTLDVIEKICNGIRLGLTYELSCQLAGVGYSTFMRWKKTAEDAKSGIYRELGDSVKRANVEARAFHLKNIAANAKGGREIEEVRESVKFDEDGDATVVERVVTKRSAAPIWQASAWILERRFPSEYGRHTPPDTGENERDPFDRWLDDLHEAEDAFGVDDVEYDGKKGDESEKA